MTKKKAFRALKYALTGLWWVALLLGAALVISFLSAHFRGEVPRVGNYSVMNIVSESMEPTIERGTYVLIKRGPAEEVREGDVICFYSTDPSIYGYPNTHRVVAEPYMEDGKLCFTTQGDHNLIPDKVPAYGEDLIGVWVMNLDVLTVFLSFITQNFMLIFLLLVVLGAGAMVASLFFGAKRSDEQNAEKKEK